MTNKEKLNSYIAKNGLRHTFERDIMLQHIETIDGHFTAFGLIETFGKRNNVSNASIYRNLKLFVEAGIVTEHNFPVPETIYELTTRAITHCHRICTICGEIKEFRDIQVSSSLKRHRFRAFKMSSANVYVYGICKKCSTNKTLNK